MIHSEVYKKYKKIFDKQTPRVKMWFPNGFNSIRIRFVGEEEEWVFTCISNKEWCYETVDSFIEKLNKNNINGGNENEI